ncbi:Tmem144 [Symbiodinium necroappetens]|uniref:Tmem144 protein n=1 Tax=Symbiodinium necroappetens TaxID=1628268 RepID=A0A812VDL7_9DINO|nr:Tmem144 [Symbiodinium necroappetens]
MCWKCGLSSLVISPPGLKSRRNLRLVVLMPVFDCMSLPACGEGRRLISASRSMYSAQMGATFGSSGPCAEFQRRREKVENTRDTNRVVLVMTGGGGQDVPWPEQLAMEGIGRPLHVLVVTGRNEEFKTRLEHALTNSAEFNDGRVVLQGNDANVTVEVAQEPGHQGGPNATYLSTERLVLLMDIADAIITKPGGGTTAEISYRGLPAVFDATRGLLHWEEFTVHAFEQQGRGERFVWPQQLGQVLSTALKRPRSSSLVEDPANPGHVLDPGPCIVAEAEKLMEVPCHQCKLFSDNPDNT